jgi:hypothetical protein
VTGSDRHAEERFDHYKEFSVGQASTAVEFIGRVDRGRVATLVEFDEAGVGGQVRNGVDRPLVGGVAEAAHVHGGEVEPILSVQGFGFLLPGEVRVYLEMTSGTPDDGVISRIGTQNAMLGGVQGALQLALVVVMVLLRYGGL